SDNVPTGVSRATDIIQVGQALYFVLSGGKRMEIGNGDPASDLDIAPALRTIINRAVSTDPAARYPDISALRMDLMELRRPLDKAREATLEHARSRLSTPATQDDLAAVREAVVATLQSDPGYPPAHALLAEIEHRIQELTIQGDLDAVRIYMESANMNRATALLADLRTRISGKQPLLDYLEYVCRELDGQAGIPAGLSPALEALLKGDAGEAGRCLVVTPEPRPTIRMQQLLLAEQLTLMMPGVTLLRPHLARLESLYPSRAVKVTAPVGAGIGPLKLVYERVVESLSDIPDEPAERARKAAEDIVDLLDVVSENAISDPGRAAGALRHAEGIDPGNPAFSALNDYLNGLHTALDILRHVTPDADTIVGFMNRARTELGAYDLNDRQFAAILQGVGSASAAWAVAGDCIALGGRRPAAEACRAAAEAIRPLNPGAARWFADYAKRVEEASHVESLSPNAANGRAIMDGWEAWDRGKAAEAKAAGEKAAKAAVTDGEKRAAQRLIDISDALANWLSEGVSDPARTDQIEDQVEALFLPDEEAIRRRFSIQMPSLPTYLKAMSKGIVEPMADTSAAALRILFFHYVLRGVLALNQDQPDDANFWREAALKTLATARQHLAYQTLDNAITRRALILEAVAALNAVRRPDDLNAARTAVRAPLAASLLEYADQAIRAVDEALRRWPDGDFRVARASLDTASELVANAEKRTGKDLSPFKNWLQDLTDSAEILAGARRTVEQAALVPADQPDPEVADALQKMVDLTRHDLGEAYTAQLRQWRDTYRAICDLYLAPETSKAEKLRAFDRHFASLFIDRQPTLPIFRHWQSVIRLLPDPQPLYSDEVHAPADAAEMETRDESEAADIPTMLRVETESPKRKLPIPLLVGGLVVLLAIVGGAAVAILSGGHNGLVLTLVGSPATAATQALTVPSNTPPPTYTLLIPSDTPAPTRTPPPTSKPFTLTPIPTSTHTVPTPTVPTDTPIPSATSPFSPVPPTLAGGVGLGTPVPATGTLPPPTLPPTAAAGNYDILTALNALDSNKIDWNKDWFGPLDRGWQLGNATVKDNSGPYIVRLGPEILTPLVGSEAALHIVRMDATIELTHYDPSLLPSGSVFFGIGFESAVNGQHVTAQAMLVQASVFDLGMNLNGTFTRKTTIAATPLVISAVRNPDKTVSLYLDNRLIGQSNGAYAPNTPLTIYMYTSTGGVVVTVKSLTLHLE
ncbi:MAG TPA: hypothetical protein VMT34_16920, partial [Aggregatilineales bacterium]|nr:hypothetical protein [Aggregatilineales bacterium]